MRFEIISLRLFALLSALALSTIVAGAQTSAFTYQGRLTDNMAAASGTYDMRFALFDSLSGGSQVGGGYDYPAVTVNNGVFFVQLDFGASAFNGSERFLQIAVRRNSNESFVYLTPRQRLTSVPYTVRAQTAASADASTRSRLIGALRWDQLINRVDYPFSNPRGIAYDGEHLWVTTAANTVSKIRPSDGAIVGTFPVGSGPRGLASDGTHIWVANSGSSTVTKLRQSDGGVEGTYPVGTGPVTVAFDGTYVWVLNNGSSDVTRLRASDGTPAGTFSAGTSPNSMAFDGTNVWLVSTSGITARRAVDGAFLGTFGPTTAVGIVFDGSHFWVSLSNSVDILKLRPSDGVQVGFAFVGADASSLAFDGRYIWAKRPNGLISRISTIDTPNSTVTFTESTPSPSGTLAFDGSHIWVTNPFGRLTRFPTIP